MNGDSIGRVVAVHGFYVRVELHTEHRSAVRASLDGVDTQVKINAYLTFEIGAGESVLGIVTDLDAREVFEPSDSELTLELTQPRRTASVQLLGTLRVKGRKAAQYHFDPGVNILPTLDTLAMPARREILTAVLSDAPRRNELTSSDDQGHQIAQASDGALVIGSATAAPDKMVLGSFNDLFSRPLAVVGNTGSGKSCTIATLVQQIGVAIADNDEDTATRPRIFILDINGEYSSAFGISSPEGGRQPNSVYVNGRPFTVPLWLMNAREVCQWLSAAEQIQEPTLKQFWSLAKGMQEDSVSHNILLLAVAAKACDSIEALVGDFSAMYRGRKIKQARTVIKSSVGKLQGEEDYIDSIGGTVNELDTAVDEIVLNDHDLDAEREHELREAVTECRGEIADVLGGEEQSIVESADKPLYIPLSTLQDPKRLTDAAKIEGLDANLGQMLRGLQLRLANRLSDKRWDCVKNYDTSGVTNVSEWFAQLGIGGGDSEPVQVIDCSMLSFEVLPYICSIVARMLLEIREFVPADKRFNDPWVLVLEEAHNYIRPRRQEEDRGAIISRETFERIAKEGRKFGLSLVVASQRPSDISPTVLSQCANFIIHRLQNPDDIEHFRKIVPSQSRRLMDQITILRAGEGIVVGSAFHIPSRVQVSRPAPEPASKSSAPYTAWQATAEPFDFDEASQNWLGGGDAD